MGAAPIIYAFSPADGAFVGASVADPSPLEPGVWLYPAFSTTLAPPTPGALQAAVFVAGAWTLCPDHRGETWYAANGAPVVVAALGDPAALGLTATPPAPPAAPLTFLQFMALFTAPEQAAIVGSADVQIKLFVIMAAGSGGLSLDNAEVVAGVNYLATAGVIAPARAAAILAGQPPA